MLKVIQKIQKVESGQKESIKQAELEGQELIEQVKKQTCQLLNDTWKNIEQEKVKIFISEKEKSSLEIQKINQEEQNKVEDLKAKAKAKTKQASVFVLGRI